MAATRADRAETASAYMSFRSGVHRRALTTVWLLGEAARAQGYRTNSPDGSPEHHFEHAALIGGQAKLWTG